MLERLSRRPSGLAFAVPGWALVAALLCIQAAPVRADVTVGTGTPAALAVIAITKPGGLVIPSSVQITMDGNNKIELSGGLATRLLLVSSGGTLTLKNLSIVRGFSASDDGGAVRNDGTLTVACCTFSDNQTSDVWSGGTAEAPAADRCG